MVYLILLIAAALTYTLKKLTLSGAFTGFLVGMLIMAGTGYQGISFLAIFFVLATLATQTKSERRTAGQVIANGGIAAIIGLIAFIYPQQKVLCQLMAAGSLASATADTLSSELGTRYGRRFINIITLKKEEKGLDGVVSLEGTLIGLTGAALIAFAYAVFNGFSALVIYIILAGVIGNLSDSILGATLERKGLMGNNLVNFLNTAIGAFICFLGIHL